MEDVYTIKVKTKPDTRNLYPSERRYSASTVSGLAWVHIALAATCLLLACLALVNPDTTNESVQSQNVSLTDNTGNGTISLQNKNNASNYLPHIANFTLEDSKFDNNQNDTVSQVNGTKLKEHEWNYILVLAPGLITVFGLAAGIACIFASVKWYVDHNITWLFVMSCLSTIVSLAAFIMVTTWFATTTGGDISEFYKEQIPFKDYFVVKQTDIIVKNESHMIIALNKPPEKEETQNLFTKRVLSINILIAAFLELLWSILSVKISYKGMRNNYKENEERRGNCISVVTKIKGNDTRKLPRNGKIPHKPDLIEHYPSKKIKRIFLAQSDNGFYLKNQQNKNKQNTETSSEFYKERMMNFLNRCASLEGLSNSEMRTPSVQSEAVLNNLNPIPEATSVDINLEETNNESNKERMTPVSWGDTPDHTIYNQNTLNLEKIFNFKQNNTLKSDSAAHSE